MFLAAKKVANGIYFSLLSEHRNGGKRSQKVERYLGDYHEAKAKLTEPKHLERLEQLALKHGLISGDRIVDNRDAIAHQIKQNKLTLPTGKFDVILADPPWKYDLRDRDSTHRNRCEYPPMSIKQICDLDVGAIAAKNCYLFLWVTKDYLPDLGKVLDAWGFEFKQMITWVKTTNDGSKTSMGMGHWLRNCTEFLAIAIKGKPKAFSSLPIGRKTRNALYAPIGKHSEKPVASYELIEALTPGVTRIELFSRSPRDGWRGWGAEAASGANGAVPMLLDAQPRS